MNALQRSTALSRRALVALSLVVVATVTSAAPAQYGEAAGIADAMRPEYLSRDVVLFVEGLELDEVQRVIVEALFDDYQDSFDEGFARLRQRYEDMRGELQTEDPKRVIRLVWAPFEDWNTEKQGLGDVFRTNVQAILNEDQIATWPAFQRRMVREKTMHEGRLSGESLNLFHVVRDMHLDKQILQQIQEVLDAYDLALDAALVQRNAANQEMQVAMLRALQEEDAALSLSILDRQVSFSVQVRDVNDQYTDAIAEALPPGVGEEFRQEALQRAYPRVYRRTAVHRMFRAALELEDIDEESTQMVSDLELTYTTELAGLNDTLVRAIRSHDPEKARYRAEAFAARIRGEELPRPVDPTRENFKRRDEIGQQYTESLQRVLSETQFAQLPGGDRWIKSQHRRQAQIDKANGKSTPPKGGEKSTLDRGQGGPGKGGKGGGSGSANSIGGGDR